MREHKQGKYLLQTTETKSVSQRQRELVPLVSLNPVLLDIWPSSLPEPVSRFFFLLTDAGALVDNMVTHNNFNVEIGVASKAAIEQATALLDELAGLVALYASQFRPANSLVSDTAGMKATDVKLTDLSNKFYMLVPTQASSVAKINSNAAIQKLLDELNSLTQQNVAANLLMAAHFQRKLMHPFETLALATKTHMAPVRPDSHEFKILSKYYTSTCGNSDLELLDILQISRQGEDERFQPHAAGKNRMLLWHGTKATNVLGILKDG